MLWIVALIVTALVASAMAQSRASQSPHANPAVVHAVEH